MCHLKRRGLVQRRRKKLLLEDDSRECVYMANPKSNVYGARSIFVKVAPCLTLVRAKSARTSPKLAGKFERISQEANDLFFLLLSLSSISRPKALVHP